jgi:glutathione S-transferase
VDGLTAGAILWRPGRFADSESAQFAVEEIGKSAAAEFADKLEQLASKSSWALGEEYSIVDPYLLTFYRWSGLIGLPIATPRGRRTRSGCSTDPQFSGLSQERS